MLLSFISFCSRWRCQLPLFQPLPHFHSSSHLHRAIHMFCCPNFCAIFCPLFNHIHTHSHHSLDDLDALFLASHLSISYLFISTQKHTHTFFFVVKRKAADQQMFKSLFPPNFQTLTLNRKPLRFSSFFLPRIYFSFLLTIFVSYSVLNDCSTMHFFCS